MQSQRAHTSARASPQLHSSSPPIEIILDPCVIPSLPSLGSLGRADLLGRAKIITPSASPSQSGAPLTSVDLERSDQHVILNRSSSLEHQKGNKAGVGAGRLHERKWSMSSGSDSGVRNDMLSPPRPKMLHRTSSFEDRTQQVPPPVKCSLPLPQAAAQARREGRSGHTRTASDSVTAVEISTAKTRHDSAQDYSMASFGPSFPGNIEACIRLASETGSTVKCQLFSNILDLIPPSRMPSPSAPPSRAGFMDPLMLFTPLAIVLEALVLERTILRGEGGLEMLRLPPLTGGRELRLGSGEGELDWKVMSPYVLAVGSVLDGLTRLLHDHADKQEVANLMKGLNMYVSKQKKVFSEVASMYVEGYSFVRGMWDESSMKASAGEVGRWGDISDA